MRVTIGPVPDRNLKRLPPKTSVGIRFDRPHSCPIVPPSKICNRVVPLRGIKCWYHRHRHRQHHHRRHHRCYPFTLLRSCVIPSHEYGVCIDSKPRRVINVEVYWRFINKSMTNTTITTTTLRTTTMPHRRRNIHPFVTCVSRN